MSKSSLRAFTLIELLIVIAIIGILMALLFPAVDGAIDGAKKAQAKNDVTQIATAFTAYEAEYGVLPDGGGKSGEVGDALLNTLTGNASATNNPRRIVFLEVSPAKKGKSGLTNSKFVDPWGNPYKYASRSYSANPPVIATAGESSLISGKDIMKSVAVWNNVTNDVTTAKQKRRAVASWE